MEKLTFTNNRGQAIEFSHKPPFLLQFIDGMGGSETNIQTQKSPYQDGETFIDTMLEGKALDIRVAIMGNITEKRSYMLNVLNPKLGEGVLRYENDDVIRDLKCVVDQTPSFPSGNDNRSVDFQQAFFSIYASNPYWQSIEKITKPLAAFIPKFSFPFSFPVKFGERGSEATLYNDGHVPCPIEIEFNGPATNPIVTSLTTGEFIRVKRELFEGDKLIINTAFGNERKVVTVDQNGNEKSEWGYIDIWESTFLQLDVGENVISYNATAGGTALVNISFKKLYTGV
ncbi:phage distal tail protein [Salipaludibacillus sp. CF4.18]|uniref:phage distal tail protein n=1 Tax=Salipaludibacillus sp. CF4.18 TaxID=3373081 RepID=UPI003EE7E07F